METPSIIVEHSGCTVSGVIGSCVLLLSWHQRGIRGGSTFGHGVDGWHSLKVSFLLCQHLQEQLDLDLSPLEYMLKCYPEIKEKEEMRKIIGRYGLTGKQQVSMSC